MDYSQYKTIKVEVSGGVAVVTLNQPEVLNAVAPSDGGPGINHLEFENIWLDLALDEEVRVIILTGSGRAFSAGGNVKRLAERSGTDAVRRGAVKATIHAPRLLWNMLSVPQPIISAVNGDAMGLGATVALFCDTVVMSESARIGDTHVRVGLVAGDGGTVIWPLLLGVGRAKDFLMRGRVIDGKEAERIGLVSYTAPAEHLAARAQELAAELLALPPLAVRWTKASANQALKDAFVRTMDGAIAYEALSILSADHAEATRAFVEKRKGQYRGE